jgi:hypothetical protein
VTSAKRRAGGILTAAAAGDLPRLRRELSRAGQPSAAGPCQDPAECERLELLTAAAHGLLTALEHSLGRSHHAPPENLGLYLRLLRHLAGPAATAAVPAPYRLRNATASISTCTSRGSRAASTVARAGALAAK